MKIYLLKRKDTANTWYNFEPMLGGIDNKPLGYYSFARRKDAIKERKRWNSGKYPIDMEIVTFTL